MSPRRVLLVVWAVLQLALPGIAALADGLASRTSVHAVAHVESGTKRNCVRVHEADCVFCQFLSAPARPGRADLALLEPTVLALAPAGTTDVPRAPPRDALASPRAPPIA